MNHKRSRHRNQSLSSWKNDKMANLTEENSQSLSNIPQSTPLHQPLWFWSQHSRWSYFNRGLFWGAVVSLTSVLSAIGGMALTTIDLVEQQISQQLYRTVELSNSQPEILSTSRQVLLVEVKPDADALIGFSETSVGVSKNILLLKLEPEKNVARVVHIPLDSRLDIPGFGVGTAQAAYETGGIELLSRALNQSSSEIKIDRYLRTSGEVFRQLANSGRINLTKCDSRLRNCADLTEQLMRQQTVFKTIRHRLNIPGYFSNFKTAIAQNQSQLDTNIDQSELILIANFIKELESERLSAKLLPNYQALATRDHELLSADFASRSSPPGSFESATANYNALQNRPVAVQNTTDDPELGRRVVAYLRSRNFREVYLVRHIPLKLEQTRIVTNYGQVETANYLKNILGVGSLETKSFPQQQLVLQLGEDALYIPQS